MSILQELLPIQPNCNCCDTPFKKGDNIQVDLDRGMLLCFSCYNLTTADNGIIQLAQAIVYLSTHPIIPEEEEEGEQQQ